MLKGYFKSFLFKIIMASQNSLISFYLFLKSKNLQSISLKKIGERSAQTLSCPSPVSGDNIIFLTRVNQGLGAGKKSDALLQRTTLHPF